MYTTILIILLVLLVALLILVVIMFILYIRNHNVVTNMKMKQLNKEINNLSSIVINMYDVSKLQNGRLELHEQAFQKNANSILELNLAMLNYMGISVYTKDNLDTSINKSASKAELKLVKTDGKSLHDKKSTITTEPETSNLNYYNNNNNVAVMCKSKEFKKT